MQDPQPEPRRYFDWAATAPLCHEAAEAMAPLLAPGMANLAWGANANSLHTEGRAAFSALEQARGALADILEARPDEIFFTSGATEADSTAILGLVAAARARMQKGAPAHVVTTSIEHEAILQPCKELERQGVRVTYVDSDRNGRIDPERIEEAIGEDTVLVSVMLANNELGTVQPIPEIARIAHAHGALMHTDAVQAFGKVDFTAGSLGADAISLSAHKICGPKGVGLLWLAKGVACEPFLRGGGQERGLRSGTQNVAGAVGFAAAACALGFASPAFDEERARQMAIRDFLYEGLCSREGVVPTVACAPGDAGFLPNIVNVCVRGLESETLILRFDRLGFAVSGGSACSSHSLEPSRVLKAIGLDRDLAFCSLRISFGRYTTHEDAEALLAAFDRVLDWKGGRR